MNLLFFCYWGVHEGLTVSTTIPNLKILANLSSIHKIVYCSVERKGTLLPPQEIHPKVEHIPLYSKNIKISVLNKISDVRVFRKSLIELIKSHEIDQLICRSSTAGGIGYLVHKKIGIPFFVESFEPHADYMLEAGVWGKTNPKYLVEKYWEKKILKYARGIMPVNYNFKHKLVSEGVPSEKVHVMPCCTPLETFKFQTSQREITRNELGIKENIIVGIYVGKFGGNYYYQEAFELFSYVNEFFEENFFLIILTPQKKEGIIRRLNSLGMLPNKFHIDCVPHGDVPNYLSAADFAFSALKKTPSKKYLSAIKHGEYWANGLPILMSEGIGEDSEIVKYHKVGGIFDINIQDSVKNAVNDIKLLLTTSRADLNTRISKLAKEHRNFSIIENVYEEIFMNKRTPSNRLR